MTVIKNIFRWLSSGFIALAVSCVAFVTLGIVYEAFGLQKRLGLDDDVCWLALLIGPALIVGIHRGFHKQAWVPVATLLGGLTMAGLGLFVFLTALKANAHHVSTGPFSGMEHVFAMGLGFCLLLVATLATLGAILALAARRIGHSAGPAH